MLVYTLKDLCKDYLKNSDNIVVCDGCRSTYLMANKGNYHYEELAESDIVGLRVFLQCDILARMEYLARLDNIQLPDWYAKYDSVACPIEENDTYKVLIDSNIFNAEAARFIVSAEDLSKSLSEFRRRNLNCPVWDYTV